MTVNNREKNTIWNKNLLALIQTHTYHKKFSTCIAYYESDNKKQKLEM